MYLQMDICVYKNGEINLRFEVGLKIFPDIWMYKLEIHRVTWKTCVTEEKRKKKLWQKVDWRNSLISGCQKKKKKKEGWSGKRETTANEVLEARRKTKPICTQIYGCFFEKENRERDHWTKVAWKVEAC